MSPFTGMVRIMDFVQSSGTVSFTHISLQMWCSWSMMQSPPCLRISPGISSVPGAFPAFSFLTAATISERRMADSLQWLGQKVGALRQEESIVG